MTTLVVAVAIVVLFVGGLFYITQNKKDTPPPKLSHQQHREVRFHQSLKNVGAILKSSNVVVWICQIFNNRVLAIILCAHQI